MLVVFAIVFHCFVDLSLSTHATLLLDVSPVLSDTMAWHFFKNSSCSVANIRAISDVVRSTAKRHLCSCNLSSSREISKIILPLRMGCVVYANDDASFPTLHLGMSFDVHI